MNHQGDQTLVFMSWECSTQLLYTEIRLLLHQSNSKCKLVVIKKQLFIEIVENILPLFTEIETNNCFTTYIRSGLKNTLSKKTTWSRFSRHFETLVYPGHFVLLQSRIIYPFEPLQANNAQILRYGVTIRLLKTPRTLSEYLLIVFNLIRWRVFLFYFR